MTERGASACRREASRFVIGPSCLKLSGDTLRFAIDERCNPLARRLRGEVLVRLEACSTEVFALTRDAAHRWGPISPWTRIEVRLTEPQLHWEGSAYVDSNEGDEAIDRGFASWDWSRAHLPDGSTAVLYEPRPRSGPTDPRDSDHHHARAGDLLALRFRNGSAASRFIPGKRQALGRSAWRIAMHTYQEGEEPARLKSRLEDTPFYARSVLQCRMLGHQVEAMHETLDARRFAGSWVQQLLPWKMPRSG